MTFQKLLQLFFIFILCAHYNHAEIRHRNFLNEASFLKEALASSNDTGASSSDDTKTDTFEISFNNASEVLRTETSSSQTNENSSNSTIIGGQMFGENFGTDSTVSSNFSGTSKVESQSSSSISAIDGSSSKSPLGTGSVSTAHLVTSFSTEIDNATDDGSEKENVARGKPKITTENSNVTTVKYETIYQKTLALISDTYTLSILIPVAAGIVFASTIILTIAICRCIRRRCRRNRLRRKILPDSVKNFRPSDKARLLAESSDEEF